MGSQLKGFDSLSTLRPARSRDEHSPPKRANPGSSPGWGAVRLSLSSRSQDVGPQAENAGAIPARDTDLPDLPEAGTGLRNRLSRFDSSQGGRAFRSLRRASSVPTTGVGEIERVTL